MLGARQTTPKPGSAAPQLTVDTALPYLVDAGLIDGDDVVNRGVVVDAVARRHQNLRIAFVDHGDQSGGYFLKQADGLAVDGVEAVATEGRFYSDVSSRSTIAPFLPALVRFDELRGVVVTGLLARHRTVRELVAADAPVHFPTRMWRHVGEMLSHVHAITPTAQGTLPWILETPDPAIDALAILGPAAVRVFQIVQHSHVYDGLRAAASEWEPSCLVHGDLRIDNVLARSTGPGRDVPASSVGDEDVRLVDWEFSGGGDPRWDVAAALADAIACSWGRFGANVCLPIVQACGRALLRGYSTALNGAPARGWAETVARFTAAHLVLVTLAEARAAVDGLDQRRAGYLRVAEEIFVDPSTAAAAFLALTDAT